MVETIRKINLRPYISGLLPLFVLAHFGHHVVGAMLRPLIPMIRSDFGLSYTQAGWIISAFSMTNGISQLPAGWLADRLGARFMVLLSVAGVAIAGALIGFSNSFIPLIILLVLAALLGGGYHPSAGSAIVSSVPAEYRGRALGFHFVGGSSTFWVVPLLAAPIAAAWGWHSAYLTLSIPTILFGALLFILIGRRRPVVIEEQKDSDGNVPGKSGRVPWKKLVPFILLSVSTGTMVQSVSSYLALYAVDVLGTSESAAAMLMAITPAVGFVAAPVGGYLSDRFGSVKVMITVSFLAAPLIFLLGTVTGVAAFAAVMVLIGMVSTTRMPTSESYIAGQTPQHRRATLLGIYFFAGTEVSGILTPAVGNLIDRVGFTDSFTIISLATGVIVLVTAFFLWRNRE